ncbi:NUDIX domain-containing protein [Patescibacteria group bacterium]|nr:NUDIX domain-containing protein [Patescibacteria group bacterium]
MRQSITSRGNQHKTSTKERREVSSGGIVFKQTDKGIYFAMLLDSYGHWTFPKGHVRLAETNEEAARREVEEEVGLTDLELIAPLGKIEIQFKDTYVFKGSLIKKTIHYFLFKVDWDALMTIPTPPEKGRGERIQGLRWVALKDVKRRSTYKDMRPILKKALEIIS